MFRNRHGAETLTIKAKPPEAGGLHTGEPGKFKSVAGLNFPYIAEFCKQILATGKVCLNLPLPGGLRCNLKGSPMRSIAYALPALPGFAGPKTYAAWPVWRDSTTAEVKFQKLSKSEAARRWHKARRFDRMTHVRGKHGGALGRTGLAVLYVLLFDFLDHATGRLEPSYDAIAAKAGVCRRAAADALRRLRDLGMLHWQRRARPEPEAGGGFRLVQETNAYASLSPSQWRGYYEAPPAPPPEPGTWGDHPPLDIIAAAAAESRAGAPLSAIGLLSTAGEYGGDGLAGALANLGRVVFGSNA